MRRHIGPLHSGYRPPPLAPSRGPLAPARRCSGASARRRRRRLSAVDLRPPAPLASGCRRQAAARRSAAAPAPRRLRAGLRPGSGPAGALGPGARPWAAPGGPGGPPSAPLRARLGPSAPRRGGSPQDGPARALPSLVPRSVGRLGGLRAPLLPPGAFRGPRRGPLSKAPRPQASGQI